MPLPPPPPYIYHPRGIFLTVYGWFEGKTLYLKTQILFTDVTDYVAAEDFNDIYLISLSSFF